MLKVSARTGERHASTSGGAAGPARPFQGKYMAKYLVIVESPTKVKAIKKFLGRNYEVKASNGHVRDLPKSQLGVDTEHDFEPKYITIRGKGDILKDLRREAKKADKVYLATDPDREGEAISWHLKTALNLEEGSYKRITFNEITKNAVKNAIKQPREIDMHLVDAQQARRVLDRLVGYKISPVLWVKVKRGLSAGRVQSAALRIICDREEEIAAFIPEEYWTLKAQLYADGEKQPFTAKFIGDANGRIPLRSREEMLAVKEALSGCSYEILALKRGSRSRKQPQPYTTSTLQQDASRYLNFSTSKTMRIAQQLYEGIDLKKNGTVGLITYLRTDSTRVSGEALEAAADYIRETFGDAYLASGHRRSDTAGRIQDAHEAIRPSAITRTPAMVKDSLSRDQFRLYQLIWNRFTASCMAPAVYETASVKIGAGRYRFTASASKLTFLGYQTVYALDEEKKDETMLSGSLTKESRLHLQELTDQQHFTQPPAHYTEASLVKALEELGIGRPSTYAPTISTLLGRHYLIKENKILYVSDLGEVVNSIMKESFPEIVSPDFTANMESLLDGIEEGKYNWKVVISNFYPDLAREVEAAEKELTKIQIADEVSDEVCEKCGRNLVVKYGPHGKFLACPGFPECRNTKPYLEKIGVPCPQCGSELVIRKTKKGRNFFGCENYPDCDFISWQRPSGKACPQCGQFMVYKGKKLVCSDAACGYREAVSE